MTLSTIQGTSAPVAKRTAKSSNAGPDPSRPFGLLWAGCDTLMIGAAAAGSYVVGSAFHRVDALR